MSASIRSTLSLILLLLGGQLAAAQQRSALTKGQVVDAAKRAGISLSEEQISLPTGLTASGPGVLLKIEAEEAENPKALRLRLRCTGETSCVPFFATASFPDLGSTQEAANIFRSSFSASLPTRSAAAITVHPGQRMHLLLKSSHMQIRLPVVVMDSGGAGSEVRVSSLDRKQLFHGVVSDGSTIQAVLP